MVIAFLVKWNLFELQIHYINIYVFVLLLSFMYTRTAQRKNCLNLVCFSEIIIGQGKEMYPVSVYNDRRISVVQVWTGESESIAYENFALFYNGRKHTVNIERLVEEAKDMLHKGPSSEVTDLCCVF